MDKDVVNFITSQNNTLRHDLKEDMTEIVSLQSTVISARVDAKIEQKMGGMDRKIDLIVAHNERQNGWINDHNTKICNNEKAVKELWFFRVIGRNPKISAAAFLIVIMGCVYGYTKINFKRTFERVTSIELVEDNQ